MFLGWSNHETWAMNLNLQHAENTSSLCESEAMFWAPQASGSEEYFWECLAASLEVVAERCAYSGALPDFDVNSDHFKDIDKVDWLEIASKYELEAYL